MADGMGGPALWLAAGCVVWCGSGGEVRGQTPDPGRDKPAILIELNKLEAAGPACRAFFVAENRTAETVRELRLDTYIFDGSA